MRHKYLFLVLIFSVILSQTNAQIEQPILRLNTEMHTHQINELSLDATGNYLLSASDDKTARLWNVNTGELLKIFRPPIGYEDDGKLYACALSPNGKIAAVAGFSNLNNDTENCIFLFNTVTGNQNVLDIQFSANGEYLAAALSGTSGINIYKSDDLNDFKIFKILTGYDDGIMKILFDKNGRLVSVSLDGKIRLYNNQFKLIKKINGTGDYPKSIAFSSDGSKIAIGYYDVPDIEVFSNCKRVRLDKFPMSESHSFSTLLCARESHVICSLAPFRAFRCSRVNSDFEYLTSNKLFSSPKDFTKNPLDDKTSNWVVSRGSTITDSYHGLCSVSKPYSRIRTGFIDSFNSMSDTFLSKSAPLLIHHSITLISS